MSSSAGKRKVDPASEATFIEGLDRDALKYFNDTVPKSQRLSKELWDGLPPARREALRVAYLGGKSARPDNTTDQMPIAPARGAFKVTKPMALYPKGKGEFEAKPSGYRGLDRVELVDAFDVMRAQTERAGGTFRLTPAQVSMGRLYGEMSRAYDDGVAPRSCIDFGPKGGGSPRDFMDNRIQMGRRLQLLRHRIGDKPVQSIRRIRPERRGSRATIMDRRLVDMVCIHDQTLSDVLKSHGWSVRTEFRAKLMVSLGDVLDRMMGPVRGCGVMAVHYGDGSSSIWGTGE